GVDGCGVPVHGMPLRAIATMYARLAEPSRAGTLEPALRRVAAAMRAHPYLVAGRHRDDTALMEATDDVLAKGGAEALDCAVSLEAGVGIAVKARDGGYRASGPAMIAVLDRLGLLSQGARRRLGSRASPPGLGDSGGMNVYILQVAERLAAQGLHVDVFARCRGGTDHEVKQVGNDARVIPIKAGPCAPLPKSELPRYLPEFLGGVLREAKT